MRPTVSSLVLLLVSAAPAAAQLVVPSASYPTIQSAIDAATPAQLVIVRPGTYQENIDFKGKDITVQGIGGAASTIIDGNQAGPCVAFTTGSTRAAILEGFTITNGLARRPGTLTIEVGGGILIHAASPTIRNCIVRNNRANAYGGGIGGTDFTGGTPVATSPLIHDCVIENNAASGLSYASGGGIALTGFNTSAAASAAEIRDCVIRDNTAAARGAGAYFGYNHNAIVEENVFTRNTTVATSGNLDGGAAVFFALNAICVIRNNRIFGNTSNSNGGGIKYFNVTGAHVVNNTIVNNVGGSIAGFANAGAFGINVSANIVNSILYGNGPTEFAFTGLDQNSMPPSAAVSYSDVSGGYPGTGNFAANPLLANPASGNHRLLAGSPCINTGDNAAANAPPTDFEGDPRPLLATIDVGADEFNPSAALLYAATATISVANPGTTNFTILGGAARANHIYVLLPSLSGTKPGLDIGSLHLPLNVDSATTILLSVFAPTFVGFLNNTGVGTPSLPLGTTPIPEMLNAEISFAAAIITPAPVLNAFTNDETLRFVP